MLDEHLRHNRQMAFVTGPRQVGKTTVCRAAGSVYLDWDNTDDRRVILRGPSAVADRAGLSRLHARPPVVVFDELHKFPRWKHFLKGFFDTYASQARIVVTGSSRMDVYRRGGDSLMGRYFLYRMHPFSLGEIAWQNIPDPKRLVRPPKRVAAADARALWDHGGFPELFVHRALRFTRRWSALRRQQLVREDIRDLTVVRELAQMETLAELLQERSGTQLVYSNLANEIQVSVDTVRRWVESLCGFHLGFLLRPWFRNISRSLRKEPKWFLYDWSSIDDQGKRAETFIACHLLKAVHGWTDLGFGQFQLGYLRDKSKREVDFVVVRDGKPWMLVEVKNADGHLSPALRYFQEQTKAPFAFQVLLDADFVEADCFASHRGPLVVPARTLLSQLL